MRQIGDLMKELGFNIDGPDSSKKAFIKHLINAANRDENIMVAKSELNCPRQEESLIQIEPVTKIRTPEQLSFDLGDPKKAG